MLPSGLAMLWEDADPQAALRSRFGLPDADAAARWVGTTLRQRWGVTVSSCDRFLLSDHNAIVWVGTDAGPLVVKIASDPRTFARLDAVAEVLVALGDAGVPVATPAPADDGVRVVVEHDRPLSVQVQSEVAGDLLDVGDLDAVRATGAALAGLHTALAELRPAALDRPWRGADLDLHARTAQVLSWLDGGPGDAAVPGALDRLRALVADLPAPERPVQLVHGDVRSANVLVHEGRVTALLDLDETGLDHPAADLGRGIALLATQFRDWGPAPAAARAALVEGYASVQPLTDVERAWAWITALTTTLGTVPPGADPTGWRGAARELTGDLPGERD